MRANKTVFWISVWSAILSVIAITVSVLLYNKYGCQIYDIIKNIFISLLGGAFLSAVTSFASYKNIRKQYIIRFSSQYTNLVNIIKQLANWFNWNYTKIDYQNNIKDNSGNDEKVKQFFNLQEKLYEYDFDKIYEVLDDFCELLFTKEPIQPFMKSMLDMVNKYNVHYMKKENQSYTLYKQGTYDEYLLFNNVIKSFADINIDEGITQLCNEHRKFLELTKINDYLKKIYKDNAD